MVRLEAVLAGQALFGQAHQEGHGLRAQAKEAARFRQQVSLFKGEGKRIENNGVKHGRSLRA